MAGRYSSFPGEKARGHKETFVKSRQNQGQTFEPKVFTTPKHLPLIRYSFVMKSVNFHLHYIFTHRTAAFYSSKEASG